ncbi:protein PSK SIMULATOR 3 [Malania oleifera]|uniref:protein PSK SIMULATOR 3 n=1 Tax=Malania oleifera TaxID=397392 RepID=UPI0025AE4C7B|nr:protein PSK SIMULATOR 3 [Malania oleifera]
MALETWLIKVRTAISSKLIDAARAAAPTTNLKLPKKSQTLGVLAFEVAGLMSKLLHLWQSLSDHSLLLLRRDSAALEGVRKLVSADDAFLLSLARAEISETLRHVADSVSRLSHRCRDSDLRSFRRLFHEFGDSGRDPLLWVLPSKEIEAKNRRMDRLVAATAALYREMEELSQTENALRKTSPAKEHKISDLQQKNFLQRQEIKYLKERSLWSRSFDAAVSLLARSIFTLLARIKITFGVPNSLPRSLSASAAVHPSSDEVKIQSNGFLEANSKLLKPAATTLGAAALALHYSNLIIVLEKMIKSPQLVGPDAREDLYGMLPRSLRWSLRRRLRGVGFCAGDPKLAGEWKDALGKILGWLAPLAHNMIKWQSERSFEHQNLAPKTNVLLFQTLYFANKEKTEAAITELLVGLNYVWRFEREMTARALFECANFNGFLQNSSTG